MVHKDTTTEVPLIEQVLEVDLRSRGDVLSEFVPSLLAVDESSFKILNCVNNMM